MNTTTTSLNFATIVALLAAAKAMIWDGTEGNTKPHRFVCCAIDSANYSVTKDSAPTPEVTYIREQIKKYIGGHYTFEAYVEDRDGREGSVSAADVYNERIAMIDALLAHAKLVATLQATLEFLLPEEGWVVGKSTYICHAMYHAVAKLSGTDSWEAKETPEYKTLQSDVIRRIGGRSDFTYFLKDFIGEVAFTELTDVEIQAQRKALVEEMIAYYIAKDVK